jgi:hypothetical protein
MEAEQLARQIEEFLADAPNSLVMEDGLTVFDLGTARYSLSTERGKCVLHFWSDERNAVRRIVDAELKSGRLRLTAQKFGAAKPVRIDLCQERDPRTPSAKKAARATYQRLFGRLLQRNFPTYAIESLSSAMDLERSFGPIYTRALLRKGQGAFAALGVGSAELQSSVDGALTFGLLWLERCREQFALRGVVEGLLLFVPQGRAAMVRARLAHLDHAAAKFRLFEVEEQDEQTAELDASDGGNISTRLVHCPDRTAVHDRFAAEIERIREVVPQAQLVVVDAGELAFRLHGLEFARARMSMHGMKREREIVFGAGRFETELTPEREPQFRELMQRVMASRRPEGSRKDPLWRMAPERWLESLIVEDVSGLDLHLDGRFVYSQVPAFAASDRAMIDVLTSTRDGRLVVLELKADEDIHLPLQGLDYWARVQWHHARGEFARFGYFSGKELSAAAPALYLVAPALRIHPATDVLLKYFSPNIDWTLLAVDERWRSGVRVVFKKKSSRSSSVGR